MLFITQKTWCQWYTSGAFFCLYIALNHWSVSHPYNMTSGHQHMSSIPCDIYVCTQVRLRHWYIVTMAKQQTDILFSRWGVQETNLANPIMHLSYIPQYTIQNRNVHISVLNGALWDMWQVHCGICECGLYRQNEPNTSRNIIESEFVDTDVLMFLMTLAHQQTQYWLISTTSFGKISSVILTDILSEWCQSKQNNHCRRQNVLWNWDRESREEDVFKLF